MLTIICCGTRGYIEESTPRHRMHSALLLVARNRRLLLDAGETWAGHIAAELRPDWIAVTHAHPDHAFGLAEPTSVPVYASAETHALLAAYPIGTRRTMRMLRWYRLGPFALLAYPVVHSIRAPAVGFKVRAEGWTLAYNPDVVSIPDEATMLGDVDCYVGDGSSLVRPLVRRRGELLFGHTTMRAQLGWCARNGVPRAIFVHCGKSVVAQPHDVVQARIDALAAGRVAARLACDGTRVRLPKRSGPVRRRARVRVAWGGGTVRRPVWRRGHRVTTLSR